MLNLVAKKSNMYGFITGTFNIIKGVCSHQCEYCYMRQYKQNPARLDEKEFKTDLGQNNFIFVGSSIDMWAEDIPSEWIRRVLEYCKRFPNKYLFQSKNPQRFHEFISEFPLITTLGITMETDDEELIKKYSKAPSIQSRIQAMKDIQGFPKMITMEPLMKFTLSNMVDFVKQVDPAWVNIGADSKGHHLMEPTKQQIDELIVELKKFTKVNLKSNLWRLNK